MSDSLTPEQQSAVSADGSVAVVAGAGTGKTKLLAHRYLHHLDNGLSPLEVVAVTFTEKAAAELRSRIRSLVRGERPSQRQAGVEIEAAQISTIHALAARICREHPERAGVAPDFAILDDLDGVIWHAERLEAAIVTLPPFILDEFEIETLRFVLGRLLSQPLGAEAALSRTPDDWRALLERERTKAMRAVIELPAWADARAALTAYGGAAHDDAEIARLACLRAMDAFEAGEAAAALEGVNSFTSNRGQKGNWPGGGINEAKAALKSVKDLLKDACEKDGRALLEWGPADDELSRLSPLLREAFGLVAARLEQDRLQERVLDFTALEVHALRALSDPEVVEYYARRWRAILVDEFQDTNPVQARLLERLRGAAATTVVGDEKQAIYGFRGADVTVFRRYRQQLHDAGGLDVVLSLGFRSHAALTASFDGVFEVLLGELHQSMKAARLVPPGDAPYVSYHPVVVEKGKAKKAAKRLSEAHVIAKLIRNLVAAEAPVTDPLSGDERPVRYGDIAILSRGKAAFETYAQVLPALGVPAIDTGGGNLLDTREAKDGIAVLRFVADPHDDLALAALLRGPFFALDDRTLLDFAATVAEHEAARLHAESGNGAKRPQRESWWRTLEASTDERLDLPRTVLASLLEQRWTLTPSRALQVLDAATGYAAIVANLPAGRRRLTDWRGFLDLVRNLEAAQNDTFAVSRRLRALLNAEVEVPRPTMQAGDAVAMMTVHKSKGLEWPVVIVADLSYEGGGGGRELFVDHEHGVSFKLTDEAGEQLEPVLHRLLKRLGEERDEQELRRLYYVAFTRARDRLILTSCEPGRGPLRFIEPALEAGGVPTFQEPHDPGLAFPDAPLPEPDEFGLVLDRRRMAAGT